MSQLGELYILRNQPLSSYNSWSDVLAAGLAVKTAKPLSLTVGGPARASSLLAVC